MLDLLANDWKDALSGELEKAYFKQLCEFLEMEYRTQQIFPSMNDIFNAFTYTPLLSVRVLILGQDPYHDDNQAHGLSFSVLPDQTRIPPSLQNIYRELNSDIGCPIPNHGYLKKWAEQGVLLLNSVMTVRAHQPNSHKNKGWEQFTDATINIINDQDRPIVIFLWGNYAQQKEKLLTNPKHLVLKAPHPSPLSAYRGFLGSKPFSLANDFLEASMIEKIDWCID